MRNCGRKNLSHKPLTFFTSYLISIFVFLMKVEYGLNPYSSPQSKAKAKPKSKDIRLHSIQDQWNITFNWVNKVNMLGMRNLESTNSSHVTLSNIHGQCPSLLDIPHTLFHRNQKKQVSTSWPGLQVYGDKNRMHHQMNHASDYHLTFCMSFVIPMQHYLLHFMPYHNPFTCTTISIVHNQSW